MDRISYLFNKKPHKPQEKITEWGNKINLEHKQILSKKGEIVCEYFVFHYIEKTSNWRYDHPVEWTQDNTRLPHRASATGCPNCTFGKALFTDGKFTSDFTSIQVSPSKDMIPLYVKWAYKISDGTFERYNGKDYASLYGTDGVYGLEKLRQIYVSMTKENHPDQLPPFVECRCGNCKYEWIVF